MSTSIDIGRRGASGGFLIGLGIFVVLSVSFVSLCGQWPIDQDEFNTLKHASKPLSVIVQRLYPVYFILTHFTLELPVSTAVALRLPAAIGASLAACAIYLTCRKTFGARAAAYAAILVITSPWLLRCSQMARFYSIGFLFAALSQIWLLQFVLTRSRTYLTLFVLAGCLSVWTHTIALIPFVASGIAAVGASFVADPRATLSRIIAHWKWGIVAIAAAALIAACSHRVVFYWLNASPGKFGDYSFPSLVTALGINTGFHVWFLAFIPMLKHLRSWSRAECILTFTVIVSIAPFLVLCQYGGGAAPRYLSYAMPSLFVLAGLQLENILSNVSARPLRIAVLAVCMTFGLPYVLSILVDGNHYDYPSVVEFVESLDEKPIVASTSHGAFEYYAKKDYELYELGFLKHLRVKDGKVEQNYVGRVLTKVLALAKQRGDPLVLVSREDRIPLDKNSAHWLLNQFSITYVAEKRRYDHKRVLMVVYEYRPKSS